MDPLRQSPGPGTLLNAVVVGLALGGYQTPEQVVATALRALDRGNRRPSITRRDVLKRTCMQALQD